MGNILGYDAASRGNRFQKLRRHIIIRNAIQISSDAVLYSSTKVLKQHAVQTSKEQILVAQASIFQSIFPQLEWNATWKRVEWTVWHTNTNTSLHVKIVVVNKNHGIHCILSAWHFLAFDFFNTKCRVWKSVFMRQLNIYDKILIHFSSYCIVHEISRR